MFEILFTETAKDTLRGLERNPAKAGLVKQIKKSLGFLQTNPRHLSLNTHEYKGFRGPRGEKVFEAYAQNKTPGAYRIFWYYGPDKKQITILAITPYP